MLALSSLCFSHNLYNILRKKPLFVVLYIICSFVSNTSTLQKKNVKFDSVFQKKYVLVFMAANNVEQDCKCKNHVFCFHLVYIHLCIFFEPVLC